MDGWITAIWLIINAKNGVSSCEVARALGVTQKSAWFVLHCARNAMKIGTFGKMTGMVEVDETFVGSLEKNKHADKKRHIGRGGIESGKHHLRSGHSGFADRLGIVFAAGKPHKRDRSRIHSGNMAVAPPVDLV